MRIAMDNVGSLWALLQCALDECATTGLIAGLTGCEPEAREIGPITMQTGIDRFHDIENSLKLACAAIEAQITTKLRDAQQVTGIGSDVGLSRGKVGVWILKQAKECRDMRTLPGQRGFCRHECTLFEDIGIR